MKTFNIHFRKIFALLLCLCLFAASSPVAFADEALDEGFIDPDQLQALVDGFVQEKGLDPEDFSIGYVYTGTGEQWYYNGDTWYYPASVYKVPLMMMLAEKVSAGELEQDSDLGGYSVALAEEYIISYSNNDYAHLVRQYLGGDEVWREHAKSYTTLDDSYYHSDYMDYCYFSPRYITQVVNTLYNESERFPNIIDCMLVAEPTHFFRLSDYMNSTYSVAQKYGSYCDNFGDNFNHTTGIIYTPTPFILTVMTLNVSNYEKVISDAALLLTEYTLSLDAELEEYKQAQEEQARLAAEAEQKAAEEKAAAEKAQAQKAEAERIAAAQAEQQAQERQQRGSLFVKLGIAAALLLVLIILVALLIGKRRKRRRYEEYERRFRQEMEQRERYRR